MRVPSFVKEAGRLSPAPPSREGLKVVEGWPALSTGPTGHENVSSRRRSAGSQTPGALGRSAHETPIGTDLDPAGALPRTPGFIAFSAARRPLGSRRRERLQAPRGRVPPERTPPEPGEVTRGDEAIGEPPNPLKDAAQDERHRSAATSDAGSAPNHRLPFPQHQGVDTQDRGASYLRVRIEIRADTHRAYGTFEPPDLRGPPCRLGPIALGRPEVAVTRIPGRLEESSAQDGWEVIAVDRQGAHRDVSSGPDTDDRLATVRDVARRIDREVDSVGGAEEHAQRETRAGASLSRTLVPDATRPITQPEPAAHRRHVRHQPPRRPEAIWAADEAIACEQRLSRLS